MSANYSVASTIVPLTVNDIYSIPIEKRIFIFWQNMTDMIPGYITLCLQTLVKFNPNYTVFFLNYSNIYYLLGDEIDWDRFLRCKLMHQSDILKIQICIKFGGRFFDADAIYTGSINWINSISQPNTLLGIRHLDGMRFNFFSINEQRNVLLWHIQELQKYRLSVSDAEILPECRWDYFGYSIALPMVRFLNNDRRLILISDETFFMERKFENGNGRTPMSNDSQVTRREIYRNFWFGESSVSISKLVDYAHYNIVMLHNSWAEDITNAMSISDIINKNCIMSRLFKFLLSVDDMSELNLVKVPCCEYKLKM